MKNDNLLFGTINLKKLSSTQRQLSDISGLDFFVVNLGLENYGNSEVSVLDFKTRVSQFHKVSNLPFYTPKLG